MGQLEVDLGTDMSIILTWTRTDELRSTGRMLPTSRAGASHGGRVHALRPAQAGRLGRHRPGGLEVRPGCGCPWAALLLLVLVRPRPLGVLRASLRAGALLGVVTAGMTLTFGRRDPTASSAPPARWSSSARSGVAVVRYPRVGRAWALVAAVGAVPDPAVGGGSADPVGVAFALVAAGCWRRTSCSRRRSATRSRASPDS